MITSLAEKLGLKRNLLAFSVHPSAVEGTAPGTYCDGETDYPALRKFFLDTEIASQISHVLTTFLEAAYKSLGNVEGWDTEFNFKS